jgi:hypothetical protein
MPIALLSAVLGTLSCGYVQAGRWSDDPKNWERAFHTLPPKGYTVLNSLFWRYPHFTYEGGYYFRLMLSAEELQSLKQNPSLTLASTKQMFMDGPCEARPPWFPPQPGAVYQVLLLRENPGNQKILIDTQSSEVFLSDCQY